MILVLKVSYLDHYAKLKDLQNKDKLVDIYIFFYLLGHKKLIIPLLPCYFVDLTLIQKLSIDYSLFSGNFYKCI
jgi:hypothetical protein